MDDMLPWRGDSGTAPTKELRLSLREWVTYCGGGGHSSKRHLAPSLSASGLLSGNVMSPTLLSQVRRPSSDATPDLELLSHQNHESNRHNLFVVYKVCGAL